MILLAAGTGALALLSWLSLWGVIETTESPSFLLLVAAVNTLACVLVLRQMRQHIST